MAGLQELAQSYGQQMLREILQAQEVQRLESPGFWLCAQATNMG